MRWTPLLVTLLPACVAPTTGTGGPDDSSAALSSSPLALAGTTAIVNAGNRLCLDVEGQSTKAGGPLQQWGCWEGANQAFRLIKTASESYEIQGAQSGLCLGAANASTVEGARIAQWGCTGALDQQFSLREGAAGQYTLADQLSGLCLGIDGGSASQGAALVQWACDGTPSQSFALTLPAGGQPTGRNYYVDPAGKDSSDGHTPQTAWQSLAKVNAAAFLPYRLWVD